MRKKVLSTLCAVGLLLTGCEKEITLSKPPPVKVQRVSLSNTTQEENYADVVRGRYETNLSFQVGGKNFLRKIQ